MSHDDRTAAAAPRERPWARVLLLALTLATLVWFGQTLWQGLAHPNRNPTRTRIGDVALATEVGVRCGEHDQLTIRMIHSPDKAEWLQQGAEAFMRRCPNMQVELRALDDVSAIDALSHDSVRPTLWMPTDDVSVDLLPPLPGLERGPSLVRSPLVVLLWKDRLEALEQLRPEGFGHLDAWASLACALPPEHPGGSPGHAAAAERWTWIEWWTQVLAEPPRQPPTWPTPAQLEPWGHVDFMHPSPSRDVAGLAVLTLIAYGRLGRDDLPEDELVEAMASGHAELEPWLARCKASEEAPLLAEGRLGHHLQWFGPTGSDGAFLYERSAIEVLRQHEAWTSQLRVVTPATTMIADHPAVYLASADDPVGKAARQLVEFLQSPEPQAWAIADGFRPTSPDVDVRYARVESNPFIQLRRFGVALELEAGEPPALDRDLLIALRESWQNATGRE